MNTPRTAHDARFDLLLALRGFAALSVVVWHSIGYKETFPAVLNTSGRIAVWLFFGISGYVIAYGFVHRRYRLVAADLGAFYQNRFLRIFPLFIALTVLAWITQWRITGVNPIALRDVPSQVFAIQWDHEYELVSVFWTLGIELQYYLLAPLLVIPLLRRPAREVPATQEGLLLGGIYAAMVAWCTFASLALGWSWDGRNIAANLPHFFAGMAACRYAASIKDHRLDRALLAGAGGLICLAGANWAYHTVPGAFWSPIGIVTADTMIVCFVIAHAHLAVRARPMSLAYTAAAMLGTLSYGVYAWHGYIMRYFPWTSDRVFLLSVMSIAAAYVSYRLIERPALSRRKRPDVARVPEAAIPMEAR